MSNAVFYVTYSDYKRKPVEGYAICPYMLESAVSAGARNIELRHRTSGVVWHIGIKKYEKVHRVGIAGKPVIPLSSLKRVDAKDPRGWE